MSDTQDSSSASRIRSSRACLYCSRRKVKCNGMHPCQTCSRDNIPCQYGEQKKRGPPKGCQSRGGRKRKPTADTQSPLPSLQHSSPDGPFEPIAPKVPAQSSRSHPLPPWQHQPRMYHHQHTHDPQPLSTYDSAHVRMLPDARSSRSSYSVSPNTHFPALAGRAVYDSSLYPSAVRQEDDFASPLRTLAHTSFLTQPLPVVATDRPWQSYSRNSSPRDAPLHRQSPAQTMSPGLPWPGRRALESEQNFEDRLPPAIVQRLLDIYQVFVHPHWPIIYLPSVTSLHSLKYTKPILFEAILAVASNTFDTETDASADDYASSSSQFDLLATDSPNGHFEPFWKPTELRAHFVQRVKKRILEGKFVHDIATIQAAVLTSVVEMGSGNFSAAFQLGGIAMRMALDMNLHRSSSSSSTMPSTTASSAHRQAGSSAEPRRNNAQTQERLRVFWACFILDKILSTVLDKPAQLRTAEIETEWPSTQEADEFDIWLNDVTMQFVQKAEMPGLEGVKVHALSTFKAWAEVMAILEKVLEQVYSPQAKRDRRKTAGESDYDALLKLNQRLAQWRNSLPPHLTWDGTWTSSHMTSLSGHRPGSVPHHGLPPHILTMRAWYCICLILLHRPRVPKLIQPPKHDNLATPDPDEHNRLVVPSQANASEPAGLEICNAAAKEVCDILHVYDTTFRIRKISSSWVYLIFQSATIHSAIAARKSVIAFKARQSSISRRDSGSANGSRLLATDEDAAPSRGSRSESVHSAITEAELDGSSDLVKTSALYLAECVRFLKRIEPTWKSATNHVAVLRSLCIASAQTKPPTPVLAPLSTEGTQLSVPEAAYTAQPTLGLLPPGVFHTMDQQHYEHKTVEVPDVRPNFGPTSSLQPADYQSQQYVAGAEQTPAQAINANDWTFWASMPVASEGYLEWDEFFRAFNPSATTDFTTHPNYHPTAAVDLITAFQDPNRLLNNGYHPT